MVLKKIILYGLLLIVMVGIVTPQAAQTTKFIVYCNGVPVGVAEVQNAVYSQIQTYVQTASTVSSVFTIDVPTSNVFDTTKHLSSSIRTNCKDVDRFLDNVESIMLTGQTTTTTAKTTTTISATTVIGGTG